MTANKSRGYKCVKILLIIGLSAYLTKYVWVAFTKFDRGLVGTNTRVESMSSFEFPSLSFCQAVNSNDTLDVFTIKDAVHGMSVPGKTSYTAVNITPSFEDKINPNLNMPNSDLWQQHPEMFWGIPYYCMNYRPPPHARTEFQGLGRVFSIKFELKKELSSLFMFLSHPKLLKTRNLFGTSVYMINSPKGEDVKYFVYSLKFMKKVKIQNGHKSSDMEIQCSDKIYEEEKDVTMDLCLKSYMKVHFPCYQNSINNNNSCSKEEKFKMHKLQGIGEDEFVKLTGCAYPCTTHIYDANLMNTVIASSTNESDGSNVVVLIYISEASMETSEEFLVYGEESLMGDIGGMVGMLMGVSILAIYEVAYESAKKIIGKILKVFG